MVVVNLRCADNVDLATIKITQFDGASLLGLDLNWRKFGREHK